MTQQMPSILSAFWVIPFFVASYGVGARILKVLRGDAGGLVIDACLGSALGWFALSYLTLGLGVLPPF